MIFEKTIDSAWRSALTECASFGHDYVVEQGSYVGQIRRQLPMFVCRIETPWVRPLAPILPPGIPPTTTDDEIGQYFARYLMSSDLAENEEYTYGQYITAQIDAAVDKFVKSGGWTNQACITVGDRDAIRLDDPPCLREISLKRIGNQLQITVFFRSWDLVAGFPQNIGGLQLLKEYVLGEVEQLGLDDGPIVAYSDGAHIYEQYFDFVDCLNVQKIR